MDRLQLWGKDLFDLPWSVAPLVIEHVVLLGP
jgi:hypothetical protein